MNSRTSRLAVIGNYLPRQCGIATFTTDLCEALAGQLGDSTVIALPVNDTEQGYNYPPRVRFEIAEREIASYLRAADFLNVNNVDGLFLQHEYGIFGGRSGSHILTLLRELRMPIITTLHTVLREPDQAQLKVLKELAALSDRLVVMSERAVAYCHDIYDIPTSKVDFIHHGIPDVSFVDPSFYKDQFGVEGKRVILTFGLLSPNKGIEYVIEALPAILDRYPDVVYLVLGATHPHLVKREGEAYRLSLQRLAKSKGVGANVLFHNRFVSLEELCEFIGAADLYITPYLNEAQITSGTLAYSVGAGKAVISTPYWYAEELLADGRGILVPFKDSQAIADKVVGLLDDETERHAMRKRAYLYGRDMVWRSVANQYLESLERAREGRSAHPRPAFSAKTLDKRPRELPPVKLTHLERMTDCTGMIQHAKYNVPNYREGYATDDNARALVLAVLLEESTECSTETVRSLAARYLSFVHHAFNTKTGRFHTFLSYDRKWLDDVGSEDAHGRALWGLGTVAGRSRDRQFRNLAGSLFDAALPATTRFTSPRALAYTLMGVQEYLRRFYGHRGAQETRRKLAAKLLDMYRNCSSTEWPWFEDILSYDNAKLPHALMACGQWMGNDEMVEASLAALRWLCEIQRMDAEHLVPVGNSGFYRRGGERARFDQQPLEAHAAVSAFLHAYRMTGDEFWRREAHRAFEWFMGGNDLGVPMFDPATGGCYDGLEPDGINQNQGAESTIAYMLALVEMSAAEHEVAVSEEVSDVEETDALPGDHLGSGKKIRETIDTEG